MKKKILALLLVVTFAFTLTACGGGGGEKKEAQQTTWEKIQAEGKLVAGLDDTYAPMGFRDENNNLVGFDIDMGAELGKRLGIEVEWQPTAWDGVIASLKAKKFDIIISGMTVTPEREAEVNFAGPYIHAAQALAVKMDNDEVVNAEDLAGKVVGTQNGSTGLVIAEELDAEYGFAEIKGYADYSLVFQDLKIGRLDGAIADNYVANNYIASMPGEFKLTGGLFGEEVQGVAIRKDDTDLFEVIDATIKDMIVDGTLAELAEKWLGGDVTAQLKEDILAERGE